MSHRTRQNRTPLPVLRGNNPWWLPSFFCRSFFPGLPRCGVSDGPATQRGSVRIGQPIRGPDAGQRRQPQRVQPGDANEVSSCRLTRLFPSPFWPVKKGTSRWVRPEGSLQQRRRSHTYSWQFTRTSTPRSRQGYRPYPLPLLIGGVPCQAMSGDPSPSSRIARQRCQKQKPAPAIAEAGRCW